MSEHYKFFQHRECEFFPCHKTEETEEFNCLFCFCPLYTKGKECGGNFSYTKNGVKDCSKCLFPHQKTHYDQVISRLRDANKKE